MYETASMTTTSANVAFSEPADNLWTSTIVPLLSIVDLVSVTPISSEVPTNEDVSSAHAEDGLSNTVTTVFRLTSTSWDVMATPTSTPPPPPAGSGTSSWEQSAAAVQAVWISILVLGALGNGLVIYTMGRHGDRSATNCYILNLALSDFAVLTIVVPFTTTMFATFDWLYGETMCKATVYLIYVTLQATCLTLTAMTIDRYFAIVHPITSIRDRTPRAAVVICIATWVASSVVCIPFIVYSGLEYRTEPSGRHVYCVNTWPSRLWTKLVNVAFVMSTYVVPLAVIVVCYTLILQHLWRSKMGTRRELTTGPVGGGEAVTGMAAVGPVTRRRRKVARMVFTVVLVFAVTWLPIHVFNLCFTLIEPFPRTEGMYNVKILCLTLSYLNSFLNPFIYAFLGDGFRRAFRKSLPRCTMRMRNHVVPDVQQQAGPSTTAETRLAGNARENTRNICQEVSPIPPVDS